MHGLGQSGLPTPPASPSYEQQLKFAAAQQQHIPSPPPSPPQFYPPRCPLAPEDRIGKFLGNSLRLTGILGTGAYGVVYSAIDVETGVRYAVKTLSKYNRDGTPLDRRQAAFQNQEIRLHFAASEHPNVVSMSKIVDEPDCIYVVLEYCPEGDLFYNITERGQYVGKDDLAKKAFLQILDAVGHCHGLGIYHRDLKPENILVSDHGDTVKLADFGLATSSPRSEDYGCGSTFYMSPECLDPSSRRPFYLCGPNDVWGLGVILVNLTCGRNPWKQASFEDSTYRAYTRNPDFLKTILPLTDELNDILRRIFTRNPDERITLPELRSRILSCTGFTLPPMPAPVQLPTPPPSPVHIKYVQDGVAACCDPPSPVSSSDEVPTCPQEEPLTYDGSSIDDPNDNFIQEQQDSTGGGPSPIPSPEPRAVVSVPQEFEHQYPVSVPVPVPEPPVQVVPVQPSYVPRFQIPFIWEMVKYAQPVAPFHPIPFHQQLPMFAATLQGY